LSATRFEREVTVRAPAARVFAELAEPARFLGLQPLLASVRELAGADGVRVFAATERVPLVGPLALPSRLRVELRPDRAAQRIAFATRAPLGIALRGAFALAEADGATRVVESVELACAGWLRRFVLPQAIRAQEALLANLKRRLEG
jgi:Polyketide cyclase / dehydrase and lipid transport